VPEVYAGPWNITVLARGYQLWETNNVEFQGGTTCELTISLEKGLTLHGRVVDKTSGKPLAGVQVSFEKNRDVYSYDAERGTAPQPAITDAAGAFALEGVPSGTVKVQARRTDYLETAEKVDADSQAFVELAVARGAAIRGQVFAADGVTPLPQAMVMLSQGSGGVGHPADASGRFAFDAQNSGHYTLEATNDTGRSEAQEVTVAEGQELSGLILRIRPAAVVRGRLSGVAAGELARRGSLPPILASIVSTW
jgi:5-hydroxyisourate hydrolase-like protein (transthyretin family)